MSYDREKRRKRRQRSLVAKELRDPKYRQRVVQSKPRKPTKKELLEGLHEEWLEAILDTEKEGENELREQSGSVPIQTERDDIRE